jgi:hypothetical protein
MITKIELLAFLCGFIITAAFMVFVAWCGGYDFNHRSPHLAAGVFTGVFISVFVGIGIVAIFKEVER